MSTLCWLSQVVSGYCNTFTHRKYCASTLGWFSQEGDGYYNTFTHRKYCTSTLGWFSQEGDGYCNTFTHRKYCTSTLGWLSQVVSAYRLTCYSWYNQSLNYICSDQPALWQFNHTAQPPGHSLPLLFNSSKIHQIYSSHICVWCLVLKGLYIYY